MSDDLIRRSRTRLALSRTDSVKPTTKATRTELRKASIKAMQKIADSILSEIEDGEREGE